MEVHDYSAASEGEMRSQISHLNQFLQCRLSVGYHIRSFFWRNDHVHVCDYVVGQYKIRTRCLQHIESLLVLLLGSCSGGCFECHEKDVLSLFAEYSDNLAVGESDMVYVYSTPFTDVRKRGDILSHEYADCAS